MPLLTHEGRSVFVDATSYGEALDAARRIFFPNAASSGVTPPRLRFRLGWPIGSFNQDFSTSVELEEGAWPEGLLPQNTQLWVVAEQAVPVPLDEPAAAGFGVAQVGGALDKDNEAVEGRKQANPEATPAAAAATPAAVSSPSPTLLDLDETDEELLKEASLPVTDAKGNLLFRVPHDNEGETTYGDIFKTAETILATKCSSLLLRAEGYTYDYEGMRQEPWYADWETAQFLTPDDSCVLDLKYLRQHEGDKRRYGISPRSQDVILDADATVLDLRRALVARDGDYAVYEAMPVGDVLIFPADSAGERPKSDKPLEDGIKLAACRNNGHPLIRLWASTHYFDTLRKEEEAQAVKRRKIKSKLSGFIVRDEKPAEE